MYAPLSYHALLFFNDTATTEIYTLSLHDALPISNEPGLGCSAQLNWLGCNHVHMPDANDPRDTLTRGVKEWRSEEHTSELQSRLHLVFRLLLEKKKQLLHSESGSS